MPAVLQFYKLFQIRISRYKICLNIIWILKFRVSKERKIFRLLLNCSQMFRDLKIQWFCLKSYLAFKMFKLFQMLPIYRQCGLFLAKWIMGINRCQGEFCWQIPVYWHLTHRWKCPVTMKLDSYGKTPIIHLRSLASKILKHLYTWTKVGKLEEND